MPNMARLLLIEDDADLVALLSFRLRRAGHEVRVAYDGSEGYFAALREQPDLILLDLLLPGFTGHQLLHLLRANPDVGRTPVIVLSALDDAQAGATRGARADIYLGKPIEFSRLLDRVDSLLASAN
jgi:DNA-binding response OmpR family regulator